MNKKPKKGITFIFKGCNITFADTVNNNDGQIPMQDMKVVNEEE